MTAWTIDPSRERQRAATWLTLGLAVLLTASGCGADGDTGGGGAEGGLLGSGSAVKDASIGDGGVRFQSDGGVPDSGIPDSGVPDTGVPDTGVPDTGLPDSGAPDTDTPDTGTPDSGTPTCPGDPTCTCVQDSDCNTGPCVTTSAGQSTCAQPCPAGTCAEGYSCVKVDAGLHCLPTDVTLCEPCTTSAACSVPGSKGARCVAIGALGNFCGKVCGVDADCPAGYGCSDTKDIDGLDTKQCQPAGGAVCSCSVRAQLKGLKTPCGSAGCAGERACLLSGKPGAPVGGGLSACSGKAATDEICNAKDDDCDGQTDEGTCDDKNPCTADTCGATGCTNIPTPGAKCDDGDACTLPDLCSGGGKPACTGTPKVCADDNPCTQDTCDAQSGACKNAAAAGPCDDGDPCTDQDTCTGGLCTGGAKTCDDKDPCTVDSCVAGKGCVAAPGKAGTPCDDGSACTSGDVCAVSGGKATCAGKATVCPGGGPCVLATCDKATGTCGVKAAPDGTACSDGKACTSGDACAKGTCVGKAKVCVDKNVCTTDSCDAKTGACVFKVSAGKVCGAGKTCSAAGVCGASCLVFEQTYGNELEAPKVSTSSDILYAVGVRSDGGTIAAGYQYSGGTSSNQGLVIRRDASGKRLWAKQYGGSGSELFRGVAMRSDGAAWVAGYSSKGTQGGTDGWLVRIDAAGKAVSSHYFGGKGTDVFYAAAPTTQGGAVLGGYRGVGGATGNDAWLVRVDAKGVATGWKEKIFGGSGSQAVYDVAYDAKSGLVAAAGYGYVSAKSNEGLLARVTPTGTLSHKLVTGPNYDMLLGVTFMPDGRIAAAGVSSSASQGGYDGWIVTASPSLGSLTQRRVGGAGHDRFESVTVAGSTLILGGYSDRRGSTSGWVVRAQLKDGAPVGESWVGGAKTDTIYGVAAYGSGIALVGRSYSYGVNGDTWQARLTSSGASSCACHSGEWTHGAESGNPKVTTSSEGLYGVCPRWGGSGAEASAGSVSGGYRNVGGSLGVQGLVINRDAGGKVRWAKTYGGSGSDYVRAVAPASGSAVWTAGYTSKGPKGGYDGWVQRLDDKGGVLQQLWFGGSASDRFMGAASTGDGGVVVGGYRSTGGATGYDLWLVRLNSAGTPVGFKDKTIPLPGADYGQSVAWHAGTKRAFVAGYRYVTGLSNQGVLGYVTDTGSTKTLDVGGAGSDVLRGLTVLPDGSVVGVGSSSTDSAGSDDAWLVRSTSSLTSALSHRWGGEGTERLYGVTAGRFGGAVVVGQSTTQSAGSDDGVAWEVNPVSGARSTPGWHFGGAKSDSLYGVARVGVGYALVGGTQSYATTRDTWLLQTDDGGEAACKPSAGSCATSSDCDDGKGCTLDVCSAGKCAFNPTPLAVCGPQAVCGATPSCGCALYNKVYGNEDESPKTTTSSEYLYDVTRARGDTPGSFAVGYVYAGSTLSNQGLVVRRDLAGKRLWAKHIGGSGSDVLRGAVARTDGGLWAVGYTSKGSIGGTDGWVVRLSSSGGVLSQKSYGTTGSDAFYGAAATSNNALVVVGRKAGTSSQGAQGWLMWLSSSGTPTGLKERTFGTSAADYAFDVAWHGPTQTTVAVGFRSVSGKSNQGVLTAVTSAGSIKSVEVGGSGSEVLYGVAINDAGNVMAVGATTTSTKGGTDGLAVRTTTSLASPKLVNHGGAGTDLLWGVHADGTSRFVAVGYSSSSVADSKGGYDGWIQGLSAYSGNPSGVNARVGTSKNDYLFAVASGDEQTWLLAGRSYAGTNGDTWQLRTNLKGSAVCPE